MKICLYNWNGILWDVIHEISKEHEIVQEPNDADVIVLWNEMQGIGWGEIIDEAHKRGQKVILYQQGVRGIDRVQPPFNEKLKSDKICVWGEGDKEHLIKYGTDPKKIFITGCPILKKLKPKVEHEGKNVVFALEHWDIDDIPENLIVASELRKLKNVGGIKVITKALEREHDLNSYDNVISTKRYDPDHLDKVADLLSLTDLVVALSESTFALLAEVMDIPVIIADIWIPKSRGGDERYKEYRHTFSDGVKRVCMADLNKKILWSLKHPEDKREERKQTSISLAGVNISDPEKELIKVINDNN